MVREILFPKNVLHSLYKDSLVFVGIMIIIFIVSFSLILKPLIDNGFSIKQIAFKCLDLSTIAVPPALPTCMCVGLAFAVNRLKSN